MHTTNEQRTDEHSKKFDREKVLKLLIKDISPVIFDVGANNGNSLSEFKSWWPEAVVHCFEPQEECWAELKKRSSRYSSESVIVNTIAVGAAMGDAPFYTHKITTGQSGFNRINTKSRDSVYLNELKNSQQGIEPYEASINHVRTVPLIRLDSYIDNASINKINLLKIDTQGYEAEVLSGTGTRLSDIDVVITELMFYDFYERSLSFTDIERFLLPAGFRLYDISHISKNPMNGRTDWVDVIYVNEKLKYSQ
jgi:FkbM family methyltransferase